MGAHRSLTDVKALVSSRRHLIAGTTLSFLLVAVLATFFLPRRYESVARVRILDNRALHTAYGRSGGTETSRCELLARIREGMAGGAAALQAVKRIDPGVRSSVDPADLVKAITEKTRITEEPGKPGELVFTVTFAGPEPTLAQSVVAELVTGFQRQKIDDRERIAEQEFEEAVRKREGAETALETAEGELAAFLKDHRDYDFGGEMDTAARLTKERRELGMLDRQLEALRIRLADVRSQLAEESEYRDAEEGEESETGKVKNEVWVDLKSSERALLSEIAVKKRMRKTIGARVAGLEKQAESYPMLKKRFDELTSRKKELAARIGELGAAEKKARARWQEQAEEGALVYDVLDAPSLPGAPAGSERMMVSLAGLLLGLCAGLGTVVLSGITDHSFKRSDEVSGLLDVPVLGAITRIETPAEREETRRKERAALLAVVVLAVLVGAAVVTQMLFDEPISSFVRDVVKLVK